jgi:ATPase subunit of ABC transporter with duplicated ATPase domains
MLSHRLSRILAREDAEFDGELQLVEGLRVGYLEQEPKLDAGDTVDENIRPALAHTQGLLDEFEQVRTCPTRQCQIRTPPQRHTAPALHAAVVSRHMHASTMSLRLTSLNAGWTAAVLIHTFIHAPRHRCIQQCLV